MIFIKIKKFYSPKVIIARVKKSSQIGNIAVQISDKEFISKYIKNICKSFKISR